MRSLIFIVILTKMIVWGHKAIAQTQTTNSVYIMPWITFNEKHDQVAELRPTLEAISRELASVWTSSPIPLQPNPEDTWSNNFRRYSAKFLTGPLSSDLPKNIAIQPIWCHIGDVQLFQLQAIDIVKRQLLASSHRAIQSDNPKLLLNNQMTQPANNELLTKTLNNTQNNSFNPLKIDLKLVTKSTRVDSGSFECLNNIVVEDLLPDFNLDTSTGNQALIHLQHLLKIKNPAPRPTRITRFEWQPPTPKLSSINSGLKLSASLSEGVLGTVFYKIKSANISLTVNNNRLTISGLDPVVQKLKEEASQLSASKVPMVVKTYGAWAYLDQGRAWGLKINDRVVEGQNPEDIKGHVVGFYGAGLNLKAPSGAPVHEGAIIYIRKGQAQVRVGQTFLFDQKTFPTPWPPQ